MKRYAIWDKQSPVITPIGEVLTAEQWISRYPVAGVPSITVVCGAGEINGSFFGTLGQMVQMYESQGADFSGCETDEDKLEALIAAINELKAKIGIKESIKDYGIDEQDFLARLDDMTEQAFDDQCTGANPRYPLMSEIKQMYLNAYYGVKEGV